MCSIHHHRANALPLVHQVEGLVDVLQGHCVGNQIVDVDASFHIPVDDFWHVGTATGATESRPPPYTARHQLKRPGGNFLARTSDTDDAALPPALVAALQRLTHHFHIADALEA